jgi:hypothetical protein
MSQTPLGEPDPQLPFTDGQQTHSTIGVSCMPNTDSIPALCNLLAACFCVFQCNLKFALLHGIMLLKAPSTGACAVVNNKKIKCTYAFLLFAFYKFSLHPCTI